jgi:hypothetical protein
VWFRFHTRTRKYLDWVWVDPWVTETQIAIPSCSWGCLRRRGTLHWSAATTTSCPACVRSPISNCTCSYTVPSDHTHSPPPPCRRRHDIQKHDWPKALLKHVLEHRYHQQTKTLKGGKSIVWRLLVWYILIISTLHQQCKFSRGFTFTYMKPLQTWWMMVSFGRLCWGILYQLIKALDQT